MTGWSLVLVLKGELLERSEALYAGMYRILEERVKASGGELKVINEGSWHPFPPPPLFLFLGSQYFVITK